jgi:hypothetical protein
MHWEILIIPLIAVGVWVLGTIFRGAEDERQKAAMRQRRPGGPYGPRPPQRRPATDLDRFLEEARRRREAAARPAPPPPPPPVARPAEPRPAERRPLRQREPERPQAVTRRPEPLAPPPPAPPEAIIAVRRAEPVVEARPPVVVVAAPAPSPPPAAPPVPVVEVRARTATGAAIQDQVAALLRSPRGAGAAFVLTEILGPPLCRRRR